MAKRQRVFKLRGMVQSLPGLVIEKLIGIQRKPLADLPQRHKWNIMEPNEEKRRRDKKVAL